MSKYEIPAYFPVKFPENCLTILGPFYKFSLASNFFASKITWSYDPKAYICTCRP